MEGKARYYYEKILRDCVIPEGLFEIKDRKSNKWNLIIEDKRNVDEIIKKLNQQDKELSKLRASYQQVKEENSQLKQQLAESENQCRECKHLNKKIELNIKNKLMTENCELQKQLVDKEQENERLKEEICKYEITLMDKNSQLKKQHQDKISFAVEQLEKVKGLITNHTQELWTCENDDIDLVLYEEIDNQIKQLKGGK